MRFTLVTTAVLASSVMLTYMTDSFADPSSNVAEANSQAELRSPAGDSRDTDAPQLLGAHETTHPEERILSMISTVVERVKSFAAKIYGVWRARTWLKKGMSAEAILNQFHAKLPSVEGQNDFEAFWNNLRQRDLLALKKFMEVTTAKNSHDAGVMSKAFSSKYGGAAMTDVLLKAQVSGKNLRAAVATKILEEQVHGWFREEKSIPQLFHTLGLLWKREEKSIPQLFHTLGLLWKREEKSIPQLFHTLGLLWKYKVFESPILERLQAYIEYYNLQKGTTYTLHDTLRELLDLTEAEFSTSLAIAKADSCTSDIATRVQDEMVADWDTHMLSVDDVIDMLIPHPLDLFQNVYRDTVEAFMKRKKIGEEKRNNLLNTWLMDSFNGNEFKFAHQLIVLQKDEGQAEAAHQCERWLFQQWGGHYETAKSLFHEIDKCKDISVSVAIEIAYRYARWDKASPK